MIMCACAWLCLTLDNLSDCPPGSSIHRIFQARILEWVAIPHSRGSSWPRDQTRSPALQADSLLSEPQGSPSDVEIVINRYFIFHFNYFMFIKMLSLCQSHFFLYIFECLSGKCLIWFPSSFFLIKI